MLLRRITEHVKEQNWFAVGIDFFIVVIGVFIGIQVANWNEARSDQKRADGYLERLTEDLVINQRTLSSRQDSYAAQIAYGAFALNSRSSPTDREAAWKIIHAYFQASHTFTIALKRGTYDEIISSGDLALLDDQNLVNALSEFYTFSGFSTIQVIPDYRENIRRIIPFEMQDYLQSECYEIIAPDTHYLLDCRPLETFDNLVVLATELRADEDLNRDLEYMLSYAGVSTDIAGNRQGRAEDVLELLEARRAD